MDIKLECVELLMCACVRLCVVRKLPTDKSPREVLEQVCLRLVWERVAWKHARFTVCGFQPERV